MAYKANKLWSFITWNLWESIFNIFVLKWWCSFSECEISFLNVSKKINFISLSLILLIFTASISFMITFMSMVLSFMMMVHFLWSFFMFFRSWTQVFVMMDDIIDLLILINMWYYLNWKLFAILVHFFEYLLFLDVNWILNIDMVFRLLIHVFHWKAEFFRG